MAATAVASPTSMYSGPPPPYTSWQGPDGPRSGLISPPDSRRTSDNKNDPPPHIQLGPPQQRQSLPSIHEALGNGGPRSNPYKSPVSASFPPAQLPFSQPLSRQYPPPEHTSFAPPPPPIYRQPTPPRPAQPQSTPYPRSEPQYAEPPRHPSLTSLQPAPGPPTQYVSQYEPSRHAQDSRIPERTPAGYPQHPPSEAGYRYGPPPHQQAPPTTSFGPSFNQPQYTPRDGRETSDSWKTYAEKAGPRDGNKSTLKRDLDVYQFENGLSEIHKATHNLSKLSTHYLPIARQQQRCVNAVPDGMPNSEECAVYLAHAKTLFETMTHLKNMVYEQEQNQLADQRMREQGQRPGAYDDEMSMYGEDMKGHGYSEGNKKRRGRAAPPGRCHSCNRAETPEWRRGPDGARTLCNACGLHYAKLTRKNNQKQSQGSNGSTSLRPKSMDGSDSRPPPLH